MMMCFFYLKEIVTTLFMISIKDCPKGRWGKDCRENCVCEHAATCNPTNGVCLCLPGWQGDDCSIPCSNGTYGLYCRHKCKCYNGGVCRPNDGLCRCTPGWMGVNCKDACPKGFYGEHCIRICDCSAPGSICDPQIGCAKDDCDQDCALRASLQPIEEEPNSNIALSVGVATTVVVIVLIIFIVAYYRSKMERLKSDLTFATYNRESGTTDEHHFNNPIYSCHGIGLPFDEASLNNTSACATICNLESEKSNLDKVRSAKEACERTPTFESDYCCIDDTKVNCYSNNIYHAIGEVKPYNIAKETICETEEKLEEDANSEAENADVEKM